MISYTTQQDRGGRLHRQGESKQTRISGLAILGIIINIDTCPWILDFTQTLEMNVRVNITTKCSVTSECVNNNNIAVFWYVVGPMGRALPANMTIVLWASHTFCGPGLIYNSICGPVLHNCCGPGLGLQGPSK